MAIDHTATTTYAGTRYAPRRNVRTCADGSPAQRKFIADLVRDIHTARVQQVRATPITALTTYTAADVEALIASMGTADEAIAHQMTQTLEYGDTGTITRLQAVRNRERKQLQEMARRNPAPATPDAPAAAELQENKTYRAPDGRVFRVVRGQSGYLYGKLWVPTGHREGYWDYYQGIRNVAGLVLMTLDEIMEFGQLTGQCSECQTPLSDPVSIVLGIGPICESQQTGKARSRAKAFRAEVLARATTDQVAQMRPEDRPQTSVEAATDAPF